MSSRSFCLLVSNLVLALLACISVLNWVVNPYGQYSPRLVHPVVRETRSEKFELFQELTEKPDGLILGSSRSLKFEPKYLKEHTSLTFFNFGVNHGRPEDFLAILRAYRDRYGCSPAVVLMAIDIASLNDLVPSDARLCAEPNLYRFVKNELPWKENFDRFCQLFSYQQTSASISALRASIGNRAPRHDEVFDSDGVIQYIKRQAEMEQDCYDFEAALDYNIREYKNLYGGMKQLSRRRLSYLFEAVRLCEQNGSQVFLFTTVYHPRLRDILASKTNFTVLEEEAIHELSRLAQGLNANFINFGSIEKFGGNQEQFYDGIHPTEFNTRLMIDRMLPTLHEALYAIH